jgi:hypothetical protein
MANILAKKPINDMSLFLDARLLAGVVDVTLFDDMFVFAILSFGTVNDLSSKCV